MPDNKFVIKGQTNIDTTTGALTIPRLTTAQRNALTAVAGMIIYNTDNAALEVYTGSVWQNPVAYVNTAANLFNYYNFI